jgi:hypothetical protein
MDQENRKMSDRDQIEDLIKKGVSEAKAEIAEGRIKHLITIGTIVTAVFGVIVPLTFMSINTSRLEDTLRDITTKADNSLYANANKIDNTLFNNTTKVENSITKMSAQFDKLAASQDKRPNLDCLVNGQAITNAVVLLDSKTHDLSFELKNIGNGAAYNVEIYLYLACKDSLSFNQSGTMFWIPVENSDNPQFNRQFQFINTASHLNAKRNWLLNGKLNFFYGKQNNISAKLLVSANDTEAPWEFHFTVLRND